MTINSVSFDGEWNAESFTGSDGDPIASWVDGSGNGHTMAPAGASNPVLKTGVVNGKQVARFTDTTAQALKASYAGTNTASTTFVVIGKLADVSGSKDGGGWLATDVTYPGGWSMGGINWGSADWGFISKNSYNVKSPGKPDTSWHVWIGNWDGTDSTIWLDGVQIAKAHLSPPDMGDPTATSNMLMGALGSVASPSSLLRGDIAFAGRADRVLTETEMGAVESYANSTYGITVTPRSGPAPAESGTGSITASASFASSGRKAAVGAVVLAATAVLTASGTGTLTSSGTGSISAAASLSSAGQKNAVGNGEIIWYGMLSGSGTGSIVESKTGTGSITGTPTTTSTGRKGAVGSIGITATAALASTGQKATTGTSSITATPTLMGSGYGGENQASSGSGSITAAYALIASGSKSTSGTGSISVTATITGNGGNAENLRDLSLTARLEPSRLTATLERA